MILIDETGTFLYVPKNFSSRYDAGGIPFYRVKTLRIYALASAILIIVGSFFLFYSLSSPTPQTGTDSTPISMGSTQWAGYVAMSNLLLRQQVVTSVSGSWVVPEVNSSQDNVYSATWVGIGGYGESSLIQTGTLHEVKDGEAVYYAWYELLPSTAVRIQSLNVDPGDLMTASISLVDESENLWSVEITDVTKEERYSRSFRYTSSRLSAEWIVERPEIVGKITTLADFGSITFTNCRATIENVTGTVSGFPGYQLVMYDDQAQLVRVSSPTGGGSSFTVEYLRTTGSQQHSTSSG